jgi:hydroxymethylglutaryl-CoA lyase
LQFVVSVSDAHNTRNAGRTLDESFEELERIGAIASEVGAVTEVTLATAFGCPYAGPVSPAKVVAAADRAAACGVSGIGLADTIGTAVPPEVAALVDRVITTQPQLPVGIHLHDTRGLAIANAMAGVEAGAIRVDGSVGGLGGCPFAPGASGNLALEDLVHAFEHMGVRTGIDLVRLIDAARLACELVGRAVSSHVGVAGPRFARMGDIAGG